MLINLSNHPSKSWDRKQINFANRKFGNILDIKFPDVNPSYSEKEVESLASEYFKKVLKIIAKHKNEFNAVHIMGEMTFCFCLISMLLHSGIKCYASTTKRIVNEDNNSFKISEFNFVKFREYKL